MDLSRIYAVALRRVREWKGLSQTELGERVGLTKSTISKLETGRQTLDASALNRCLEATGISLSAFHRLCETIEQEGRVMDREAPSRPSRSPKAGPPPDATDERLLILHQEVGTVPGSRMKLEVDLYLRPF